MEEHELWVTAIVNRLLGKPALALLTLLRLHAENPRAPIPNHIAMELLVFLLAIAFFLWLKARLSVERPGAAQQCMETLLSNPLGLGVRDLLEGFVGHDSERYMPMLGSIGIFVLLCNLISLVPSLESPTAERSVPLGCAVVVFLYYHWCGVRRRGAAKYGRHFLGPDVGLPFPVNMILPGIMLVVELFSHAARLLSLTARLWANMFVSELLYGIFLGLTVTLFLFVGHLNPAGYSLGLLPLVGPPVFILLHLFVGVVQAFVFTILPVIYLGGAVAEQH